MIVAIVWLIACSYDGIFSFKNFGVKKKSMNNAGGMDVMNECVNWLKCTRVSVCDKDWVIDITFEIYCVQF